MEGSIQNINVKLAPFAQELVEQDADKNITMSELKNFIAKNEEKLGDAGFSADDALNELSSILTDEETQKTEEGKADDAEKTEGNTPIEQYNALKNKITEYEKTLKELGDKKETLNNQLTKLQEKYEAEQNSYLKLEESLKKENEEYKKVIEKINSATQELAEDVKHKQKAAVFNAMADFDPESGEDWDKFLAGYLEKAGADEGLTSSLKGLISKTDFMAADLKALGSKLGKQAKVLGDLSDQINNVNIQLNDITELETTTMQALEQAKADLDKSILNLVSDKERALVDANNVDLTELLPDGSPRYLFAKGKEDGQYHIYDMAEKGKSLARQFGKEGKLRGTDIIPKGNGYLRDYQELGECTDGGEEVFSLGACGQVVSRRACYRTTSPLSFDINGDGVKTSSKVIKYDIDGDGIIDNINDSADAVLVFDKDGDGISGKDGSECFGNNTDIDGDGKADGYKDGFEALKALAKKEGLIDGKNDNKLDADDLSKLQEKYGLKIKTEGYNSDAKSLADVGITEINFSKSDATKMQDNFDGNGNQLMTQEGATFKVNGETREYADIWHRKLDLSSPNDAGKNMFMAQSSKEIAENFDNFSKQVQESQLEAQQIIQESKNAIKKLFKK